MLDLVIEGQVGIGKIWRDLEGACFEDSTANIMGLHAAAAAWGDYDNDGDLDLVVSGYWYDDPAFILEAILYRNDAGIFVKVPAPFVGVELGALAWGDYDNDGDLDLLLTGEAGEVNASKIYRNDGGTFTDIGAGLTGARLSDAAWGDYDNDGDLDLVIAGHTGETYGTSTYATRIYRNDAGSFSPIGASLLGVIWPALAWGDYDNDGDLDLVVTGLPDGGVPTTRVYRNENGSFVAYGAGLHGFNYCSLAWGDYDTDGDLDLAISGATASSGGDELTNVYRNDGHVFNQEPWPPTSLATEINRNDVTFRWDSGSDTETPEAGLSYNLRVGTTPGSDDVQGAMADLTTGFRRVPAMGNVQKNLSWTLRGLPEGTYYWSVQSIDTAYAGSHFATDQVFVVSETTPPAVTDVSPPAGSTIRTSVIDIDVTFSEPVFGVDATDMELNGSAGASATVAQPTNEPGSNTWRFPIAGLVTGTLEIALASEPGDIEDGAGNDLDPRPVRYSYHVDTCRLSSDCDDTNACTDDLCDVTAGCTHSPRADDVPCPDDSFCNGVEKCHLGVCRDAFDPCGERELCDEVEDRCIADCNNNGVSDGNDILMGTSQDCDGNGTPDECDIELGGHNDCNSNRIPDVCEGDDDEDGVIDECDTCADTPTGVPVDPDGCALPGACCFLGITCLEPIYRGVCIAIGGTFVGYGMTCAGDPDEDGFVGCNDECPMDSNKADPGVCGCGMADDDSDSDGVADCIDMCPNTPVGYGVDEDGCPLSSGDFDDDGDVDLQDYYALCVCMWSGGGPGNPALFEECKYTFDSNADGDVDLNDFGHFQIAFTGNGG